MAGVRPHAPDGLEEYDNPLPRWWLYGFYLTIAFSIVYSIYYPSLWCWDGALHWTSEGQYAQQIQRAATAYRPQASPGDDLEKTSKDAQIVSDGRAIFKKNCAVCHGDNAEGKIGPSLHDHDWRYGGDQESILTTIRGGRPKGMPTWGKILPNDQIQHVAAYVYTLSTKHPKPAAPLKVGVR